MAKETMQISKWEYFPGYLGDPNVITRVLIKGRQEVGKERRCYTAGFKDRDQLPRWLPEAGKGEERDSLLDLEKEPCESILNFCPLGAV